MSLSAYLAGTIMNHLLLVQDKPLEQNNLFFLILFPSVNKSLINSYVKINSQSRPPLQVQFPSSCYHIYSYFCHPIGMSVKACPSSPFLLWFFRVKNYGNLLCMVTSYGRVEQKAYKLFFCLATEIAQPFCSNFSLVLELLTIKVSL